MQQPLRLATWNVNSLRAHLGQVLSWLERVMPEAIALQETMCAPGSGPLREVAKLGFEVAAIGGVGGGGVALASRVGLTDVRLGVPGAVGPFAEPRLVSADVGGLRLHGVYAPNGRKVGTEAHRIKLAWFQFLAAVLEGDGVAEGRTVLLGDLNIAPTDADVWEPSRYRARNLTSPPERAAYRRLLDTGLVDVVPPGSFTWWNRRGDFYASDRGWRLDHLLASPAVAERVVSVAVDREVRGEPGGSDHAPILVELSAGLSAGMQPT